MPALTPLTITLTYVAKKCFISAFTYLFVSTLFPRLGDAPSNSRWRAVDRGWEHAADPGGEVRRRVSGHLARVPVQTDQGLFGNQRTHPVGKRGQGRGRTHPRRHQGRAGGRSTRHQQGRRRRLLEVVLVGREARGWGPRRGTRWGEERLPTCAVVDSVTKTNTYRFLFLHFTVMHMVKFQFRTKTSKNSSNFRL